ETPPRQERHPFPTRRSSDLLGQPSREQGQGKGPGGREEGEFQLLLEIKIDDIVDWLWEEMQLPNLKARAGASDETEWTREGWDRRGARSRLEIGRASCRESVQIAGGGVSRKGKVVKPGIQQLGYATQDDSVPITANYTLSFDSLRSALSGIDAFFFASRRRHTSFSRDWSSDVCSSDLLALGRDAAAEPEGARRRVRRDGMDARGLGPPRRTLAP